MLPLGPRFVEDAAIHGRQFLFAPSRGPLLAGVGSHRHRCQGRQHNSKDDTTGGGHGRCRLRRPDLVAWDATTRRRLVCEREPKLYVTYPSGAGMGLHYRLMHMFTS